MSHVSVSATLDSSAQAQHLEASRHCHGFHEVPNHPNLACAPPGCWSTMAWCPCTSVSPLPPPPSTPSISRPTQGSASQPFFRPRCRRRRQPSCPPSSLQSSLQHFLPYGPHRHPPSFLPSCHPRTLPGRLPPCQQSCPPSCPPAHQRSSQAKGQAECPPQRLQLHLLGGPRGDQPR